MDTTATDDLNLDEYIQFAKKLAHKAGNIMVTNEDYPQPFPNDHKYINEFVAELIEDFIGAEIAKTYPGHSLFKGETEVREFEWICDYIDGAYAYSRKHRISVTSIALVNNGKTIAAAVYNPWTDTMYTATLGGGFYVNGQNYLSQPLAEYKGSLVDIEWWRNASYDVDSWMHDFSIKNDVYALHVGSVIYAACLVANGIFAAAVLGKFMSGKNHEIAAIKLLIEEAGCLLSDLRGKDVTNAGDIEGLVFANKGIHPDLITSYATYNI